jgi:peptidoglycan/xylan/chitin deacetylase (PgdA/CDA1 family)
MGRLRILYYHTVEAREMTTFARQLTYLARRGLTFCSLSEGLLRLHEPGSGDSVAVSFDDADATVCVNARKVLGDEGIQGILYLTSDYVLQGSYRHGGLRAAATWEQLGRWLEAGHEVGGHTHTHVNLPRCPPEQRAEEWARCREAIARHLGAAPVHLSFPWGRYDAAVLDQLRASGEWRSAATTLRGWNDAATDPFELRRDRVEPSWSGVRAWAQVLIGGWPPLYRLRHRLGRVGAIVRGQGARLTGARG